MSDKKFELGKWKSDGNRLSVLEEAIACVCLGFLCGFYYIMLIFIPVIVFLCAKRNMVGIAILVILLTLSFSPLSFKPNQTFINSSLFKIFRKYFNFKWLNDLVMEPGQTYVFLEFPHSVFPLGNFISASVISDCFPSSEYICGVGADILFKIPIIRQVFAALGTRPATKDHMQRIIDNKHHLAVIAGGIAEIYFASRDEQVKTSKIFFNSRKGIIKFAIQNKAHLVPVFFFGNDRAFDNYSYLGEKDSIDCIITIIVLLNA